MEVINFHLTQDILFFTTGALTVFLFLKCDNKFEALALRSVSLLDILLIEEKDSNFDTILEGKIRESLMSLFAFLGVVTLALLPSILIFGFFNPTHKYATMSYIFGSSIPLIFYYRFSKKNSDYGFFSRLLHRLVLNNYNLGKRLLKNQTKNITEENKIHQNTVLVTGLARSGTTAMTRVLFECGNFASLDYSNMPFLLNPNLWKKIHKPRKNSKTERAHGDGILHGLDSVEALEEYFFKVQTKDSFISDLYLHEHSISFEVFSKYISYQSSIAAGKIYLAKNNNQILRLNSLLKFTDKIKVILLFRDPLQHARSLLNQHNLFLKLNTSDPFTSEYMNWLGHHEFGINHKPFKFNNSLVNTTYNSHELDYWICRWIEYYEYALQLSGVVFVSYESFLERPHDTLHHISKELNICLNYGDVKIFQKENSNINVDNEPLINTARNLYQQLIDRTNYTLK